jgi:hypothetical protein
MDLRDDIQTQIADLSDWLRSVANEDKLAAPATRGEIVEGLLDRSTFLDTFVIPRLPTQMRHVALKKFESASGALAVVNPPGALQDDDGVNGEHAQRPTTEPVDDQDDRYTARDARQ